MNRKDENEKDINMVHHDAVWCRNDGIWLWESLSSIGDLPIAVLIEVIGIITLIVGEHFYLKSQKDETP